MAAVSSACDVFGGTLLPGPAQPYRAVGQHARTEHANILPCRTFTELWDDDGETEQGRNELINKVYNFVDIPTVTVGDEAEMPLISFGTGPAVENETRWEIKQAIQAGHRSAQASAAHDAAMLRWLYS